MILTITSNESINDSLKRLNSGDTLYLKNGNYNEKVVILNNNIIIKGESRDGVVISNHDWFTKIMPDYNECNTFRTYTILVGGDNVRMENLTIENTCVPSHKYGQAVALYAEGNNFYAENLNILGAQDTLFTGPLPLDLIERHQGFLPEFQLHGKPSHQTYKKCLIAGDVDFIFGCAQVLFDECDILSINMSVCALVDGYICAPAHYENSKFGYLFYKCNIIAEEGVKNVYLGRPWRDYGKAAFIKCNLGPHINPNGYHKWIEERDKTATFIEYTENTDLSNRVSWSHILNKQDANEYYDKFMEELKK